MYQNKGFLYRKTTSCFRECDPPLFDALAQVIASGRRQAAALEDPAILSAAFYSEALDFSRTAKPEREAIRAGWHQKALDKLKGRDLIFADPDNGLIVPSAGEGPKSSKYVLPPELADYYRQGSSVVYYQHKARLPDEFYIRQHRQLMDSGAFPGAGGAGLKFMSTSQRFYFFLLQPEHIAPVNNCIRRMLASPWNRCFQSLEGLTRSQHRLLPLSRRRAHGPADRLPPHRGHPAQDGRWGDDLAAPDGVEYEISAPIS